MFKEICVRGGILGSIRWHDGDGNENFKNAIGWIDKITTLHTQQAISKFLACNHPAVT